jgi:PEP-CTERM motif
MFSMNFKKHLLTTAAATTALIGALSSPAQAFSFNSGTGGIQFERDTTVDFTFNESHGYFKEIFGVQEIGGAKTNLLWETTRSDNSSSANDWQGTCGKAVINCKTSFTFKAGKAYSFFLDAIDNYGGTYLLGEAAKLFNAPTAATVLADTTYRDYNQSPNSLLAKTPGSTNPNPLAGPVLIAFEDYGLTNTSTDDHVDFNDFMITAQAQATVPEPATLGGLGLIAGALVVSRRRRVNQAS